MKSQETYFKFPVRVFDPHSARRARAAAEQEFNTEKVKVEHAKGYAALPYSEVRGLAYHDGFMSHREIDSVKERGFDSTMVLTPTMGDFMSSLSLEKFEQLLFNYLDRMDAYIEEQHRVQSAAFAAGADDENT